VASGASSKSAQSSMRRQSQPEAVCSQMRTRCARSMSASISGRRRSASSRSRVFVHGVVAVLDEVADLVERQAGALRDVDHGQAPQHGAVVAALAADALRLGQQADLLVVADQRHPDPGPAGDVSDAHARFAHVGS
jgi:hypothetical protein